MRCLILGARGLRSIMLICLAGCTLPVGPTLLVLLDRSGQDRDLWGSNVMKWPANMFCCRSPGGSEELGCLPGGCVGDGHVDSWGQMPWFLAPLRQGSGDWCVERLAGKLAAAAQLRRGKLLQLGPLSLQGSQLEQPPP